MLNFKKIMYFFLKNFNLFLYNLFSFDISYFLPLPRLILKKKSYFWFLDWKFFEIFKNRKMNYPKYKKPKIHKNWEITNSIFNLSIISKLSFFDKQKIFKKENKFKTKINPYMLEYYLYKKCFFPYLYIEIEPYKNKRKKQRGIVKRIYREKINYLGRQLIIAHILVKKILKKKKKNYLSRSENIILKYILFLQKNEFPDKDIYLE